MNVHAPNADRYNDRPESWFRRCGTSGLKLPAISLGAWHNFGGPGTDSVGHADEASMQDHARELLVTAFDHGITHFDLANNYGPPPGEAERRVGRVIGDDLAAYRDELLISTKAGYVMHPGPYGDGGSRKYLLASLDASLQRMGIDYVDIFYHHRPDPDTPLEETLGALDQAVRSGKALYAGISNYNGEQTARAVEIVERENFAPLLIHQVNYSLFRRGPEEDLFPVTEQHGLGTIAFCPLAQGLLTAKYLDGIPDDSRARQEAGFLKPDGVTEKAVRRARTLSTIAADRGQTLPQLALAWVTRPGAATSALIGASRPE
ncbi:MAG: aldo/keto reductase, partial [Phycisphaeraceae bacterium]|nr:aldo/keto reductase [Phycisphaeraceae bacterium]